MHIGKNLITNNLSIHKENLARRIVCPIRSEINKHANTALLHSIEWVEEFNLLPESKQYKKLCNSRMADMAARFYPRVSLNNLNIAADLICWAFVLDDCGDETMVGKKPMQFSALLARLAEILDGARPTTSDSALAHGLANIQQRLATQAMPTAMCRWREGAKELFSALIWESANREQQRIPNMHDFVAMRSGAGAVPLFMPLIEILNNISLPDELRRNSKLHDLTALAGNIMCWINDILSIEKELQNDDVHNLILVQWQEHNCTITEAIKHAIDICNKDISAFFAGIFTLPQMDEIHHKECERYIADLKSMIRGTLDWTLESARYHTA